jgi:hypothetical protein
MLSVAIEPEYKSGETGIYQDAALRVMKYRKTLDPLRFIDLDHDTGTGMPTWASCWRSTEINEDQNTMPPISHGSEIISEQITG